MRLSRPLNDANFKALIKKDLDQVFLLTSPIPYPFHFAVHAWFVTQSKGQVNRYEFGKFKGSPHPQNIGLLKNFFEPITGMNKYWWQPKYRHPSKLIGAIEGSTASEASRLIYFLENQSESYPYKEHYHYLGPNSNTYIAWVLHHFPAVGLKLPAAAVGRGFGL